MKSPARSSSSKDSVRGHRRDVRIGFAGKAVVLVAGLATCASRQQLPISQPTPPSPETPAAAALSAKAGPEWLYKFPTVCAVGETGPTMIPTDALAESRRKARARLATRNADHHTNRSATAVIDSTEQIKVRQIILENSVGTVQNAEIVTMWYDAVGSGPAHAPGSAYAMACPSNNVPPDAATWISRWREQRGGPHWIYTLPGQSNRLCVVGICGPTVKQSDASTNAEDIARKELAEAISMRAESTSAVLNDETLYAAVTTPCETCEERAKAGRIIERWFDDRGDGPFPYPGTAYALMCLDL
jgi:hypothetical protein